MGGAFIAVADDPVSGLYNPAALRQLKRVGMDFFFNTATTGAPDHLGLAMANPGTDRGSAFAMGIYSQGLLEKRDLLYYVPYTGTSLTLSRTTHLGLVMRFPYRTSRIDGISSHWATLADLSLLQTFRAFRLGAGIERTFGGGGEMVPRRLRAGLAYQSASGVTMAYEWQGAETQTRFDFHRSASQCGLEIPVARYALLRAGYQAAATHRYSFGAAVGNIEEGFRVEAAWDLPTVKNGSTRWSVGMGYRI